MNKSILCAIAELAPKDNPELKALLLEELNANFITNDSNRALTEVDIDRVMQNNPLELCMLKPIDPNVIAENPNLDMLFLDIEQIPVILESA